MSVTSSQRQGSPYLAGPLLSREPVAGVQRALETSQILVHEGDLEEARRVLYAAVQADPACTEAWLRLAWLAQSRQERKSCLQQVLSLEPHHEKARDELARLLAGDSAEESRAERPRTRGRRFLWLGGLLLLVLAAAIVALLFFVPQDEGLAWLLPAAEPTATPRPTDTAAETAARFVPRLEAALSDRAWEDALELVDMMRGVDPSGEDVVRWALTTHVLYGQALVQDGRAGQALAQFDQAVAAAPDDEEARLWQESTQTYLRGLEALETGDLEVATQSLAQVYGRIPSYRDVFTLLVDAYRRQGQAALDAGKWTLAIESLDEADEKVRAAPIVVDILYQAHLQRGILRQEKKEYEQARTDLEAALNLRPDDAQAQAHLDEVMYKLFPPKWIEIDISKQRLFAWEGDEKVHNFVVSTGLPGQDTATGNFEVLDKIPMAYSSIWRLKMPYWLGIYYVRNVENGIHALPIRPDGSVMWGGLLGQRASYGCIILNNQAARTLYEWAEIGTVVKIHN